MLTLPMGLTARIDHLVETADTATRWGNELPVLATPVLLWLGEVAAMAAVTSYLEPDEMSLGVSHDSTHLAPTPIGGLVRIVATLRRTNGRRMVFGVAAEDERGQVLTGTHTRAVVSRQRFLNALEARVGVDLRNYDVEPDPSRERTVRHALVVEAQHAAEAA
jgi:fluoroacetyl-CoA thioesterase